MRRVAIPEHGERERDIQKAILDYLAAERIWAIRLNTLALRNAANRPVRSHSAGAGMADVLAFVRGKEWAIPTDVQVDVVVPLWIECKRPGAVQSPLQKSFQSKVLSEGHEYVVASSVEHVIEAVRRLRG